MEGDPFSVFGYDPQKDNKLTQKFQSSLVQVQSILDQNRLLINEINKNHETRLPDNLSRNSVLIRELNNNIRRVVELYADMSRFLVTSNDTSSEGDSNGTKLPQKRNRPG
ncbi:unnamed protein product [Amaranthus hypochondriacus]